MEDRPTLVRILATEAFDGLPQLFHRTQAMLRSAVAAVAAERYRRTHGAWPASMAVLVPERLAKVPTDPFDGQPLRLARFVAGIVIYSVGPDRSDNGGQVDLNPGRPSSDLGFRLWNARHRRQPSRPAE
jgi:hypothetical protein